MTTGFFFDERCLWHSGAGYALTAPVGNLVQPLAAGGLPEDPETKRRLKNLLDVTGLILELNVSSAAPASRQDLERIHPASYLDAFKNLSDGQGGEVFPLSRTPFGMGGYETAALSAGLVKGALFSVLQGKNQNAYALSRPPGHHCLPEAPNGFCLLANIAIAVEAARAEGLANRFAVIDWDVHHGNGTEAIFLQDPDVLTVSIHQDRCYPPDTGQFEVVGEGEGAGTNLNIPLPAGAGHDTYLDAMDRLIVPIVKQFCPDVIVIACGFDASGVDPLSRMICTSNTYVEMTRRVMACAKSSCEKRLVMAHEGGYSEVHVPFCAHGVLQTMSESLIHAPDPLAPQLEGQQPNNEMQAVFTKIIDRYQQRLQSSS